MATEDSECRCEVCVRMCREIPCRPLPEEVFRMPPDVRARLMIQADGQGLYGIPHLQAGAVGHAGKEAPDFGVWLGKVTVTHACTFQSRDGSCELHGRCKPFEGRVAIHGDDGAHQLKKLQEAWETAEGEEVLVRWLRERVGG